MRTRQGPSTAKRIKWWKISTNFLQTDWAYRVRNLTIRFNYPSCERLHLLCCVALHLPLSLYTYCYGCTWVASVIWCRFHLVLVHSDVHRKNVSKSEKTTTVDGA